jgi:uncharacterized membrane protein YtjA (UPF0391 family)
MEKTNENEYGIMFSLFGTRQCNQLLIHLNFKTMLRWTVIFLIVAIIAAVFGFGGIAAGAASIAKVLFFIFLVLFILSLIFGRRGSNV